MKDNCHAYSIGDKTYYIYDSGIVKEVDKNNNKKTIDVWDLVVAIEKKYEV